MRRLRRGTCLLVVALVLASCSARERWVDQSGVGQPRSVIDDAPGPEHCGWESATILQFRERQYVRDPARIFGEDQVATSYEPNLRLPMDAAFTGFTKGQQELWTSASEPAAVYMVYPDHAERWPELRARCL